MIVIDQTSISWPMHIAIGALRVVLAPLTLYDAWRARRERRRLGVVVRSLWGGVGARRRH